LYPIIQYRAVWTPAQKTTGVTDENKYLNCRHPGSLLSRDPEILTSLTLLLFD